MNITECQPGDIVAVLWKDHRCPSPQGTPCQCRYDLYSSWFHNTEVPVLVFAPGKKKTNCVVEIVDLDTMEPVSPSRMYFLGPEAQVTEIIIPSKWGVAGRDHGGDANDPLSSSMGKFKLETT